MGRMSQNYDEQLMQQTVVFADSLKEMKNLRKQLYSAAEFFEHTYTSNDDHQRIHIMKSLRDYSVKALVNTIDHLGSVASKVENLIDEKIGQFGTAEIRFSCIEQRVGAWKEVVNRHGLAQQMLLIDTPNHHKHYILPIAAAKSEARAEPASAIYQNSSIDEFKEGFSPLLTSSVVKRGTSPLLSIRNMHSASPALEPSSSPQAFLLMRSASGKDTEKLQAQLQGFPLIQSGALVSRLTLQNGFSHKKQHLLLSPLRRSNSSATRGQRDKKAKDLEEYTSRTKRIFRAFVSMRKPNKDTRTHSYLSQT